MIAEPSQEEAFPQTSSSSSPAAEAEADTMSTFTPPKEQEDLEAEGGLSKGYGLAPGTTNTYAIPGMDEMSAEGTYVIHSTTVCFGFDLFTFGLNIFFFRLFFKRRGGGGCEVSLESFVDSTQSWE